MQNTSTTENDHPPICNATHLLDFAKICKTPPITNKQAGMAVCLFDHDTHTKLEHVQRSRFCCCSGGTWRNMQCSARGYSSSFLFGFFGLRDRLLALHRGQMGALRWICWWHDMQAYNIPRTKSHIHHLQRHIHK